MHLLLPPSEAKTPGGRGRPIRNSLAGGDPLALARRRAAGSLAELLDGDPAHAADALFIPAGPAAAALAANARVLDAPTAPALRRYAGIVYDGLDFDGLEPDAQRLAARSTFVFSGLWGVVRGDEPIPDYRVPAKARLPGLGIAATYWRPVLTEVLGARLRRGIVVDLRSSDYSAMWRPDPATAPRVITVRVLSRVPRGGHAVISHTSKLSKGRLAAALVRRALAGLPVDGVDDLAAAWRECGGLSSTATSERHLDLYTD